MSEQLIAALAAREKVTLCWKREERCNDCPADYPDKECPDYEHIEDLALAWIAEVVDYLEAYAETMRDSTQEWDRDIVARLDSLLARVGR